MKAALFLNKLMKIMRLQDLVKHNQSLATAARASLRVMCSV
jgi:hypothetical protein